MAQKKKLTDLIVATIKLFREDILLLKTRAAGTGVPWQTQLRALVHASLTGPQMRAFKFIIPGDKPRVICEDPHIEAEGMLIVVIATSHEEALTRGRNFLIENGREHRWIDAADVVELPLDRSIVVAVSAN
jgi:hypothetical protein